MYAEISKLNCSIAETAGFRRVECDIEVYVFGNPLLMPDGRSLDNNMHELIATLRRGDNDSLRCFTRGVLGAFAVLWCMHGRVEFYASPGTGGGYIAETTDSWFISDSENRVVGALDQIGLNEPEMIRYIAGAVMPNMIGCIVKNVSRVIGGRLLSFSNQTMTTRFILQNSASKPSSTCELKETMVNSVEALGNAGRPIILLFSGGIDSCFLLLHAINSGANVYPVVIDTGGGRSLANEEEIIRARIVSRELGFGLHEIIVDRHDEESFHHDWLGIVKHAVMAHDGYHFPQFQSKWLMPFCVEHGIDKPIVVDGQNMDAIIGVDFTVNPRELSWGKRIDQMKRRLPFCRNYMQHVQSKGCIGGALRKRMRLGKAEDVYGEVLQAFLLRRNYFTDYVPFNRLREDIGNNAYEVFSSYAQNEELPGIEDMFRMSLDVASSSTNRLQLLIRAINYGTYCQSAVHQRQYYAESKWDHHNPVSDSPTIGKYLQSYLCLDDVYAAKKTLYDDFKMMTGLDYIQLIQRGRSEISEEVALAKNSKFGEGIRETREHFRRSYLWRKYVLNWLDEHDSIILDLLPASSISEIVKRIYRDIKFGRIRTDCIIRNHAFSDHAVVALWRMEYFLRNALK